MEMQKKLSILLSLCFLTLFYAHIILCHAQQPHVTFQELKDSDLPLIHTWLQQPFVKKWFSHEAVPWQDFLAFREEIKNYFGTGKEYIVSVNEHPFGYIRYYDAHLWVDGLGEVEPEGTYGIDLYIGDADYLGKGYGTALLRQFIKKILEDQKVLGKPIKQIIVDVDVTNTAAINLYAKLGFSLDRELDDPRWGKQYLMLLDPELFEFLEGVRYCYDIDSSHDLSPEQFVAYRALLMDTTWAQLAAAGVTFDDCVQFLNTYGHILKSQLESNYSQRSHGLDPVSKKTIKLIHEVLIDFGIDPNSIVIIPYRSKGSPAAADDYTLYIDEQDMEGLCPESQRFILAHEISHFQSRDNGFESALENLMYEQKTEAQRKAFYMFSHATEICADIDAMLNGLMYAQGGIKFLELLINCYGDAASFTHPSPSVRLKIAQDIEAMHRDQIIKKKPSRNLDGSIGRATIYYTVHSP